MVSHKRLFQLLLIVGLVGVQSAGAMYRIVKEKKEKEAQLQAVRDRIERQKEERKNRQGKQSKQRKPSNEGDQKAEATRAVTALVPVSPVNKKEDKGKEKVENNYKGKDFTSILPEEVVLLIIELSLSKESPIRLLRSTVSLRLVSHMFNRLVKECFSTEHEKLTHLLRRFGLGINDRCIFNFGQRLLHIAIKKNHLKLCLALLTMGADPFAEDNWCQIPLIHAKPEVLKAIKEYLANPENDNDKKQNAEEIDQKIKNSYTDRTNISRFFRESPLHKLVIVSYKPTETERELDDLVRCKRYCPDACLDNKGQTPLWFAASFNNVPCVKKLIELKADVNAVDNEGATPLWVASSWGYGEVVKMLLSSGADVNKADNESKTPLWVASFWGNIEVVKVLLAYGADVNKADSEGYEPLQVARENDKQEIVAILEKAIAERKKQEEHSKEEKED